jgi:hypothetical protein|tara:strand:- start:1291 stop:2316 length:1026 start_codon:yes stop_codon:yes gene_type:complete
MAVNSFFHSNNVAAISTEQSLYSNLVAEAIQIHGHDVFYMDRTIVAEDSVLGGDTLSKFKDAAKIEMYMENADGGFAGEREIMNQFGLQNLSEATFVVNKIRFQELTKQVTIESGTSADVDGTTVEEGGSILLEAGTLAETTTSLEGSDFYIISETDATDSDRPFEGDAIYHPILKKMFQVNFVDHDEPFFQLDNNPVYKLRCRLFDYASEELDTGIDDIDDIQGVLSTSTAEYQFTMESESAVVNAMTMEDNSGRIIHENNTDELVVYEDSDMTTSAGVLLLENDADTGNKEYLIQEDYILGDGTTTGAQGAQNELFESADDTVLDFSESNPFGDVGSNS